MKDPISSHGISTIYRIFKLMSYSLFSYFFFCLLQLYATLDSVALESDGSQKRKDDRPPPTEYADINFLKKEPDQNAGEAV